MTSTQPTVLLVHGAFADGSSRREVIADARADGIPVRARRSTSGPQADQNPRPDGGRRTGTRVRPRVWVGVLAFLAYLAVFYTIWIVNGIDYARIGESEDTLLRWYVAPSTGGLIVILVVVSAFGWWRPSLHEERRLPRLVWVPAVMAAVAILNLVFADHSRVTPAMWVLLVVGSVLVGFNEEVITRGQLLVALRSRFGETGVWFFSTLLFALLHLPNAFFGVGALAFLQVLIQLGLGSVFYLARRFSGSLVPAMVLHGLWDFSIFSSAVPYAGLVGPFVGIAGVVVVVVLLRRDGRSRRDRRPAPAVASQKGVM